MKSAADIWICNVCRSINPISSNRCYRCHTPIEIAAAKPDELTVHQSPREAHTEIVGTFRSTETLATLVTVVAVAFILATFLALWTVYTVNDLRVTEGRAAADALFGQRLPFIVPAPILGILALLCYALWIRRVIEDLPALGLGFARVSPTWAFVEPLIPGFNVYSIPARIAEVIQKLGGHLYATALIGLAWILIVFPAVGLAYLARFTRFLGSGADLLRVTSIGAIVVFAFDAVALALMLVVIWQVEKMLREKAATLAGGAKAAPAGSGGNAEAVS
jgi:hypothetical protein